MNDTDAQVEALNGIVREQSLSLAMFTNALPTVQEGITDLPATVLNDTKTRIRASEQASVETSKPQTRIGLRRI